MTKSADAFRTISEVADWLGVQPHVLRFWESKFSQVKPVKRAGGRRYYRPNDMMLLGGIRKLLHDDGLTIKGVQKMIREEGVAHVSDLSPPLDEQLEPIAWDAPVEDLPVPDPAQPDMFASPDTRPADTFVQHSPAARTDPEPPEASPVTSAPRAEETPSAPQTAERQPEPIPEAPMAEDVQPAPATVTSLPGFMTARKQPEADAPAPSADTEAGAPVNLPHVLHDATPETEAPEEAEAAPAELTRAQSPDTPQAAPLIVEAPDPDEAALTATPGALTAAIRTARLSPEQRRAVLPLVARLAVHQRRLASDPAPGPLT